MRRGLILTGILLMVGVALLGLHGSSVSLLDIVREPFKALRSSQQQLNATLLDVSVNTGPIEAASRRLLRPLGVVKLIRVFPAKEAEPLEKR